MSGPLVPVSYFHSVCDRILKPYLDLLSFRAIETEPDELGDTTTAAYSNGEIVLRLSYGPEDFPNYCLMIGLGFQQERWPLTDAGIGLWYAMPRDKREAWPFRNKEELDRVLRRIRDTILPEYAEPLWNDPQILRQLINRFWSEESAKTESERVASERLRAEAAFRSGNYADVVRIYRQVSPVDLTPTDQKRFEIARKKLL